jgi:hypothetical protein
MATLEDAHRIASALAEATSDAGGFAYRVDGKLFTWIWMERVQPKRPRVPNPAVIAIRVADETEKQAMLALDPEVFFTEPHYDGYPAVLIRLPAIDEVLLEKVIGDAWRLRAPRRLSE